jgi:hypothetical protein
MEGFTQPTTTRRALIAENAWPVLDWLLRIFERDELLTEHDGLRELGFESYTA